ncbi:MAG TPA: protein kinase [Candidatus Dojkabacteria bacterium]
MPETQTLIQAEFPDINGQAIGSGGLATVYETTNPLVAGKLFHENVPGEYVKMFPGAWDEEGNNYRVFIEDIQREIEDAGGVEQFFEREFTDHGWGFDENYRLFREAFLQYASLVDESNIIPIFGLEFRSDGFGNYEAVIYMRRMKRSLIDRIGRDSIDVPDFISNKLINVAQALDNAHSQGILHRDVKTGNIMLDDKDEPFLGDFGFALQGRNSNGSRFFTPTYMAPEQEGGSLSCVKESD